MANVTVVNLTTEQKSHYTGLTPAGAVIAAYAQGLGDWNTWDYWTKYSKHLVYGAKTVAMGDYAARLGNDDETVEMPTVPTCKDCGKAIAKPKDSCGTGYATDAETGDFICYDCCAYRDKGEMIITGRATLYLSKTDKPRVLATVGTANRDPDWWGNGYYHVTNWPGSLRFEHVSVKRGRHNIARVRYDVWFVCNGYWWHGVQYGDNTQIVHCKRTKEKAGGL